MMQKTTLHSKMVCIVMASTLLLFITSCTKDSADNTPYEIQAGKKFSPTEKPVVDKKDVRVKPDRSKDDTLIIGTY